MTQRVIDVAAMSAPVHEAVGRAISQFATIEGCLAQIYAWSMRPAPPVQAFLSFDAIHILSPKLRVLAAVARPAMAPDDFATLEGLMKRVSARGDFRVKAAHWVVGLWSPDGMPIRSGDQRLEARLLPPWFSAKNLDFNPAETITRAELDAFTAACADIGNRLMALLVKLQSSKQ